MRRAIVAYHEKGRSRLFAELQATIDGLRAENQALKRNLAALDAAQQHIDGMLDRQQRIVAAPDGPAGGGAAKPAAPRRLVLAQETVPRCTPEAAERFVRQNPRRAWEQVLHATDGRPDVERRAVWINALLGRLHSLGAVRAFVEQVLRDSQEPAPKPPEAPA